MYLDMDTIQFLRKVLTDKKRKCELELLQTFAPTHEAYAKRYVRLELVNELQQEFEQLIRQTEDYDEDDDQ